MNAEQFAQVKALYALVSDLPESVRRERLREATSDMAVIEEVLKLCSATKNITARLAKPILSALQISPNDQLNVGDVLGAWTLTEAIGAGGMGLVFKAKRSDGHFEQTAAVKLLSGVASKEALSYLARERQILASLVHPNIARLLDGGSTKTGQPYLVMEYVEGLTFDRYCQQQQLSQPDMLKLFLDVCEAVAFAHQNLVVHCDLKPSNILITKTGRAILLDFGVSHLLSEATVETTAHEQRNNESNAVLTNAAFTPRYASPEQKQFRRVSAATDIFSLGMMLAELLGVYDRGDDTDADLSKDSAGQLALHRLPRDLAAIIARATRATTQERYASVDALMQDVLRFLSHRPVAAVAQSKFHIAQLWLRRNWLGAAVGAAFFLTVIGFSWRMRTERNNALQAERAAVAVKDYMVSVFQGADPEISGQRDLSVSALLNAGRDSLKVNLKNQPSERAEIGGILGSVYQNIGQREQALKMFDEAIAIERNNNRPKKLTELLYKQAYTLYDMEDFQRAQPIAEDVVARYEKLAPNSIELAESLRLLGGILNYAGDADKAAPILQRALQMANAVAGVHSLLAAKLHLDVARLHVFNEPFPKDAIPHAAKAVQIIFKQKGATHYLYPDALEIHSLALSNTNQFDAALPLIKESTERRLKLYGEISNQAGYSLYTYASLLNRMGLRTEAVAMFERCVVIQKHLDGEETLASDVPIYLMAQTMLRAGRLEDAAAAFEKSRLIRAKHLAEADRGESELGFFRGQILRLEGKLTEALDVSGAVLQVRQSNPKTHPFRLFQSQLEMAAILREVGRFDESTNLLNAMDRTAVGDATWQLSQLDFEWGRIAAAKGELETALIFFKKAEAALGNGLGVDHPDVWLSKIDRAELLLKSNQTKAARDLVNEIALKAKSSIAKDGYWDRRLKAITAY